MMIFRYFLILLSAASLSAPTYAEDKVVDPAAIQALKNLQKLDQRLHEVGFRLTTKNASFCKDTIFRSGMLLHDIAQYEDKAAAKAVHKFESPISINAVTGHNARSVQPGDGFLTINSHKLSEVVANDPALEKELPQYRRLAATNKFVAAELKHSMQFQSNSSSASFVRDGEILYTPISPHRSCVSQFQIRPDKNREASADGKIVSITSALAEYTESGDELAAIAAHELAHNLLKHNERLNEQKVNRSFFGQFGKSSKRIKQTEIEADQLSVWLMANAGYDPQAAVRFWTRYGKEHGKGIFSASTHYRWKKRVKLFEEEIAKMLVIQSEGEKFPPPLLMETR